MQLLQRFQQNWKEKFSSLLPKEKKVLLAVSGGLDSVVLADLLSRAEIDFAMAHCNFHLRGEDSNKDEAFVKQLAATYQKQFFVKSFETEKIALREKRGIEETARNLRYNWFSELLYKNEDLFLVATAHHANDNIETLLINFFRGTGIAGLAGIPEINNSIIRPLLFAKRKEIAAYAKGNNLNWQQDITNLSDSFTRNAFRLNIFPEIQKHFPEAENNLLHNIERFREINALYRQVVESSKKKLFEQRGKEYFLPVLLWQKTPAAATLLWEYLKAFSFTSKQIAEVEKLFTADNGSYVLSASHRIFKNRHHLVVADLQTSHAGKILIDTEDKTINFPGGKLKIIRYPNDRKINTDKSVALLDASQIKFPLLLRKWKTGDYFYPLGMKKKKKLSRFFVDHKLSLSEKENVWVLEADKKIIWVLDMRIDERFRISDKTKEVLKIVYIP